MIALFGPNIAETQPVQGVFGGPTGEVGGDVVDLVVGAVALDDVVNSLDDDLVSLAAACHPQTLRQMRWTNTMIKELSPQILTSL